MEINNNPFMDGEYRILPFPYPIEPKVESEESLIEELEEEKAKKEPSKNVEHRALSSFRLTQTNPETQGCFSNEVNPPIEEGTVRILPFPYPITALPPIHQEAKERKAIQESVKLQEMLDGETIDSIEKTTTGYVVFTEKSFIKVDINYLPREDGSVGPAAFELSFQDKKPYLF